MPGCVLSCVRSQHGYGREWRKCVHGRALCGSIAVFPLALPSLRAPHNHTLPAVRLHNPQSHWTPLMTRYSEEGYVYVGSPPPQSTQCPNAPTPLHSKAPLPPCLPTVTLDTMSRCSDEGYVNVGSPFLRPPQCPYLCCLRPLPFPLTFRPLNATVTTKVPAFLALGSPAVTLDTMTRYSEEGYVYVGSPGFGPGGSFPANMPGQQQQQESKSGEAGEDGDGDGSSPQPTALWYSLRATVEGHLYVRTMDRWAWFCTATLGLPAIYMSGHDSCRGPVGRLGASGRWEPVCALGGPYQATCLGSSSSSSSRRRRRERSRGGGGGGGGRMEAETAAGPSSFVARHGGGAPVRAHH